MTDNSQENEKTSPDLTDRVFGDSRIIRRIGIGAMAEVYLADQRSLDRRIAIKILKPDLARDTNYVNRFVREAKAAARLVHPNIVHIYEVDCSDGIWYISQEYVQGTNLQFYVQKHGALSPKRTFEILWQVASALDKASQEGIVHRDIKPENILLGDSGEVKVADFGLARVLDLIGSEATQLTQVGMTLGTPLYMSPEQSEGKPTDQRSDIYSLGITCYHMLAGYPPFRGDTPLAVAIQHLKNDPEPLEIVRPDIPPPLARIVHRMIAKSPDQRFQSVRELLHELKQLHTQYFSEVFSTENLSDWNLLHLDSTDAMILASTERLQSTMRTEKKIHDKKYARQKLAAICVLFAALVAGLAAYSHTYRKPIELPAPTTDWNEFPKMDTVERQWIIAARFDTEESWNSVLTYFKNEEYWCDRAKQQLARVYMREDKVYDAAVIFEDFAERYDTEKEYLAFGYLGMMWCNARIGDYGKAMDWYYWYLELGSDSYDPQVWFIHNEAFKEIQKESSNPRSTVRR